MDDIYDISRELKCEYALQPVAQGFDEANWAIDRYNKALKDAWDASEHLLNCLRNLNRYNEAALANLDEDGYRDMGLTKTRVLEVQMAKSVVQHIDQQIGTKRPELFRECAANHAAGIPRLHPPIIKIIRPDNQTP